MIRGILVLLCLGLAACEVAPPTPQEAADRCEERARAAQGPSVGVTVGANSNTGGFGSASIGVSGDFLRGRDPVEVYESCVFRLTGEAPIRPVRLRSL